jgi:hypothetical protein
VLKSEHDIVGEANDDHASAYVLGLPDATRGSISRGRTQDLPVLVRCVSVRARGL